MSFSVGMGRAEQGGALPGEAKLGVDEKTGAETAAEKLIELSVELPEILL